MTILETDVLARQFIQAIQSGDMQNHLDLATARFINAKGYSRTALHLATDWPGHVPNVAQTIAALAAAGADPNAQVTGNPDHAETPLHWAASSDDVDAIEALLAAGADIEHPGAVFTNGTPMSDAVIFAQWNAARLLLARGAKTTITESAALGLQDRLEAFFTTGTPTPHDKTAALWHACRGGQLRSAQSLISHGADPNWIGWDHLTPLACAVQSGNADLITWLRSVTSQ